MTAPIPPEAGAGRGVGQLGQGEFDLAQSVGGVRGLLESIAPGLVFVVVFVATRELPWALIGAVALALIAAVSRLIARSSLNYVLGGLVGVGIGTVWAWRTGQAEDFFVWGLYVNAFGVVIALASIIARWPLVGVLVGTLVPPLSQWRQDRYARRLLTWATWLWVILFGLRLAVQVPLYINAQVGWLGTARLVMGVPLWAIILYLTWLLVHPVIRRAKAATAQAPAAQDLAAQAPAERASRQAKGDPDQSTAVEPESDPRPPESGSPSESGDAQQY